MRQKKRYITPYAYQVMDDEVKKVTPNVDLNVHDEETENSATHFIKTIKTAVEDSLYSAIDSLSDEERSALFQQKFDNDTPTSFASTTEEWERLSKETDLSSVLEKNAVSERLSKETDLSSVFEKNAVSERSEPKTKH